MNPPKYFCETCNVGCNYISIWNQHIETKRHKNNGILIRESKYNKNCEFCNFVAKHRDGLNTHILSRHSDKEEREKKFTYYCKGCDFGSFDEKAYNIHCQRKRHLLLKSDN
jgi:hypothetical protein